MYVYLYFFIVYAFLGWCAEVAFAAVNSGEFVNRGFLNGPICPIYGFGVVTVVGLLTPVKDNKWLLFLGAVIVTSIIEFVTGWVLEKIFKKRWWDYSDMPFNIGGYVCLKFSILWGLACLLVMEIIHPGIYYLISSIPEKIGYIVLVIFYGIIFIDVIATAQTILKLNRQLAEINQIAEKIHYFSDEIGKKVSSESLRVADRLEESKKITEELKVNAQLNIASKKEQLERLIEQRNNLFNKNYFGKRRIIKAFPKMSSKNYRKELSQLKKKILGKMINPVQDENDNRRLK